MDISVFFTDEEFSFIQMFLEKYSLDLHDLLLLSLLSLSAKPIQDVNIHNYFDLSDMLANGVD